ncbi:hypothetical protein FQN54_007720 [Arachnomyces sp. PD_36]|nr:hypothetical protein FQN54_007720 [Arachnomyces sp. PD_36]
MHKDAEKNKYFRIQANHQVPRQSTSSSSTQGKRGTSTGVGIYSLDEVKRRKRDEETRKHESNLKTRQEREMIKQSPILKHPLTEISLGREVSANPPPRISSSSAIPGVNADMSRSGGNDALREERGVAVASQMERKVLVRAKQGGRECGISCFARDWGSGELFVGTEETRGNDMLSYKASKGSGAHSWQYGGPNHDMVFPNIVPLERTTHSISITPSRYLLQLIFQPMRGSATRTVKLAGRYISEFSVDTRPHFRDDHSPNGIIYWCSSPRPGSSNPCFAVGSNKGLLTVESSPDLDTTCNFLRIENVEVKAVDWLSSNVIIAGTRSSQVLFHDTRSEGTTVRVQHRHGVHSVKKVDDCRIAVAGWGNNMAIYDLRYAPTYTKEEAEDPYLRPATRKTYRKTNNPKSKYSHSFTKPYLTFPEYYSGDETGKPTNIDISTELGLLATSSETNTVDLFSIRTGSRINLPPYSLRGKPTIMNYKYPSEERIRQVQFESGGQDDTVAPRLLVGAGSVVEEWSW